MTTKLVNLVKIPILKFQYHQFLFKSFILDTATDRSNSKQENKAKY